MGAAERGLLWTDKEMDALLQIWKSDYIKSQLSTTHRNSKVFLQFSTKLKGRGFNQTTLPGSSEKIIWPHETNFDLVDSRKCKVATIRCTGQNLDFVSKRNKV